MKPKGIKIKFTNVTFKKTKQQIKQDILQSTVSDPENRKEIARVFQMANRRIQNIEKSGLLSPAVAGLNKGEITVYSKFSMRGDWTKLKTEYGKAISFLRQPTSTLSGLKEYNNHLKDTYNLTDNEFELMSRSLNDKLGSINDSNFVERYLMRYKDFTGEMEMEAKDVSDIIEDDAIQLSRAIEDEIEREAERIAQHEANFEKMKDALVKSLNKWGKWGKIEIRMTEK